MSNDGQGMVASSPDSPPDSPQMGKVGGGESGTRLICYFPCPFTAVDSVNMF